MALEADVEYDFYIKVRPDVVLTKPLDGIWTVATGALYVPGRIRGKTCSDMFYLGRREVFEELLGFCDFFYEKVDAVAGIWNDGLTTESLFMRFLTEREIAVNYLNMNAYPVFWLVSDICSRAKNKRHQEFKLKYYRAVAEYARMFKPSVFDLKPV